MDRYLGITNIKMLYVPFKSRSLEKLARAGAQPETSQNISLHNQNSRSYCSHYCDYSEIDLRLIICNICNINYIQLNTWDIYFCLERTLPRHEIYKLYANEHRNLHMNPSSQPKKV